MSAFILFNELRKKDKVRGKFSFFRKEFNKSNNTGA